MCDYRAVVNYLYKASLGLRQRVLWNNDSLHYKLNPSTAVCINCYWMWTTWIFINVKKISFYFHFILFGMIRWGSWLLPPPHEIKFRFRDLSEFWYSCNVQNLKQQQLFCWQKYNDIWISYFKWDKWQSKLLCIFQLKYFFIVRLYGDPSFYKKIKYKNFLFILHKNVH